MVFKSSANFLFFVAFILFVSVNASAKNLEIGYGHEALFYSTYLKLGRNKAYAISPNGAWHMSFEFSDIESATVDALKKCNSISSKSNKKYNQCYIYAKNDIIVGPKPKIYLNEVPAGSILSIRNPRYIYYMPIKRGVVLNVHGCDNSPNPAKWEREWIKEFLSRGLDVVSPNSFAEKRPKPLCGWTQNRKEVNKRTNIVKFRIGQIRRAIIDLKSKYPTVPIFIWGHSEGGAIAQLINDKVDGIIVTGQSCGLVHDVAVSSTLVRADVPLTFIFGLKDKYVTQGGFKTISDIRKTCPQRVSSKKLSFVALINGDHFPNVQQPEVLEQLDKILPPRISENDWEKIPSRDVIGDMMQRGAPAVIRELQIAPTQVVKIWQTFLQKLSLYEGSIDGIYGAGTHNGILRCSKNNQCWD